MEDTEGIEEVEKRIVYFMRKKGRKGRQYFFQGATNDLSYIPHRYYFSFLTSRESADWIEEESKTKDCILLYEKLRETLISADSKDDNFIYDEESKKIIDISRQLLETVKLHVDNTNLKSGKAAEID